MLVSSEATMVGPLVEHGSGAAAGGAAFALPCAAAVKSGRRFAAAVPAMSVADWIRVRRVSLEFVISDGPWTAPGNVSLLICDGGEEFLGRYCGIALRTARA